MASAFAAAPSASQAQTLPTGGVAIHGQAAISKPAPNQMTVTTQNGAGTNHSAINWQSFSIGAGASANFVQPNAASTSINRVVTNTPSALFGNLSSNGKLVLVNQAGIAVGAGAMIDTAGFTASTLRMTDADALAGRLRFGDAGSSLGSLGITVDGRITASNGDVVLIAPNIDVGTSALVKAPNGSTVLAAGRQVEITGRGYEGITMLVQAPEDQVRNLGTLQGNAVGIFAGTLRHSGEIQATAASLEGGTVVLKAAGDAIVDGNATISAVGAAAGAKGGSVDVLGNRVAISGHALVDVSGAAGGGNIRIGGDFQGKNAAVQNADKTFLGTDAMLRADALQSGDGGRVIVWSDGQTRANGGISAQGGAGGGDGGFVEVSGKQFLGFRAAVQLAAPHGRAGSLLLDPLNLIIDNVAEINGDGSTGDDVSGNIIFADYPGASSAITAAQVAALLASGDLTLEATNAITVGQAISTLSGGHTLTLEAMGGMDINAPITNIGGAIYLMAGYGSSGGITLAANLDAGSGTVTLLGHGGITQSGGAIIAGSLSASGSLGNVTLTGANNNVGSAVLGSGSSSVSFNNTAAAYNLSGSGGGGLTVTGTGAVTVNSGVNFTSIDISSDAGISLAANVTSQGSLVLRTVNSAINQTAGNVVAIATTLNAGSGNISLPSTTNDTLLLTATGGSLMFVDNNSLMVDVAGLSTTGNITLSTPNTGGTITMNGNVNAGAGNITLTANGNISQSSTNLAIFGSTLFATSSLGSLTLDGANAVAAGRFSTYGGGSTVFNNLYPDYDLSGSGGSLTVTATGHAKVSLAASYASDVSISSNAGITLSFPLSSSSGNVTLASTTGPITQTAGGGITGNSTTTLNAGTQDIDLSLGSNILNVVNLTGGNVTTVASGGMIVNSLSSGTNKNVFLQAAGGTLLLPGTAINAGTGQISLLSSGGPLQVPGALTGASITLQGLTGLEIANSVTSTGDLTLTGQGTGISQSAGTISVAGPTAVFGGTTPVSLAQPGNNFNTIAATGSTITIRDTNALDLGAVSASTSLTVQANGNVTQSAPLVVAGTTSVDAGSGNITLTNTSNVLHLLAASGGAIAVANGAISDLTANTVTSGANQPVTLSSGAGLTVTPNINTGTANLSLSAGDFLTVSGALAGNNIALNAATALTLGSGISATGTLTAGTSDANSLMAVNNDIVSTGSMVLSLSGGLRVESSGTTQAGLDAFSGQTIKAQYVEVIGNGSAGAFIRNASGSQSITTSGMNSSGEGVLVRNDGSGSNLAFISNTAGAQTIIVNNADVMRVVGQGSDTFVSSTDVSVGSQTILLQGSGQNRLEVGSATATGYSRIDGVSQAITAGQTTQAGGIQITGGVADGKFASVTNFNGAAQAISTTGTLSLTGGSAPGAGVSGCMSACVNLANQSGSGQSITAGGIALLGGSGSGNQNFVSISSTALQAIYVTGGGTLSVVGGSGSGSGNSAIVTGASQSLDFTAGGNLLITGGTVGTQNFAKVDAFDTAGQQTLTGVTALSITGGSSGSSNTAWISSSHSQDLAAGTGGMYLLGGGGTGNSAALFQSTTSGSQIVRSAGDITVQGGAGAGGGNSAYLYSVGSGGQTVTMSNTASIVMLGGTVGNGNSVRIHSENGDQTMTGVGLLSLEGGASGGIANTSNNASILSGTTTTTAGSQFITAQFYELEGGAAGIENLAQIRQGSATTGLTGVQTLTVGSGGTALLSAGGGTSNFARIQAYGTTQTVAFSAGSAINLVGGTGTSLNFARLQAVNGNQIITGAPDVRLFGGAAGGLDGNGNFADIRANVGTQNLALGALAMAGGDAGIENAATIFGATAQTLSASGISMVGGAGGGGVDDGNRAFLYTNGTQLINVGAGGIHLTGGGGALTDNAASIEQLGTTGTQTINISGGSIVMAGGSSFGANVGGTGHGSRTSLYSEGSAQVIHFTGGGSISMTGGTNGSRNQATIYAENAGIQTIDGVSSITMVGGASGGIAGEGNRAMIGTNSGTQSISVGAMSLAGGAAGTENHAAILQDAGTVSNTGTQTITVTGGGTVALQGGGGGTDNSAAIQGYGTDQVLAFSSGGALNLTGGSGVHGSSARVVSTNGTQHITGAPAIALVGGASGGDDTNSNFAAVRAAGAQTITAGSTSLLGGLSGVQNYAGLFSPLQNISVAGNLTLTGRGSAATSDGQSGGGARIGGQAGLVTDLTLSVTGDITLTGGTVAGAAIGSNIVGGTATDIDITAGGSVTLNPGTGVAAAARIGSPAGGLASGDINITATNSISVNGTVAGAAAVRTLGDVAFTADHLFINNTVMGGFVDLTGSNSVSLGGVAALSASATSGYTLVLVSGAGGFTNTAGTAPLSVAGSAHWLVFSDTPATDSRGGLVFDFKQYGEGVAAATSDASSILGTGNGFLYASSPTVTATLLGTASKTYDGSTTATLTAANYSITATDGDVVTLGTPASISYDTKNVGPSKFVTATGITVSSVTSGGATVYGYSTNLGTIGGSIGAITTANIGAVGGITAVSKTYDSTTAAGLVTTGAAFTGMVGGDNLTVASATGVFTDKNVGADKTVNISGITLGGTDAGNYVLVNNTATATADIAQASLNVAGGIVANNKVYDGTVTANFTTSNATFSGLFSGDAVTVTSATGAFADKNAGNAKPVSVSAATLGGADAGNYVVGSIPGSTSANITQASIRAVSGVTASKTYDGNAIATSVDTSSASFTGMVAGDNLGLSAGSGSFSDRNVGTGKSLSANALALTGTDAGNYTLGTTTASGTGTIVQRLLATWSGSGGNALWSNASNWDYLPDGANVATVSIPAGTGSVTMDVAGVRLLGLTSARPVTQTSTGSFVTTLLSLDTQGGIALTNSANQISGLTATNGGSGDIVINNSTALSIRSMSNTAGSILVDNLGAVNTSNLVKASGDVVIAARSPLAVGVGGITAGNNINLAAGTATNPGVADNLSIFGPLNAGNTVTLFAGNNLVQNSAVYGANGVTATALLGKIAYGLGATTDNTPVLYTEGGLPVTPPPRSADAAQPKPDPGPTPPPGPGPMQEVAALAEIGNALAEQQQNNDKDKDKKKDQDAIVTEGEVCK